MPPQSDGGDFFIHLVKSNPITLRDNFTEQVDRLCELDQGVMDIDSECEILGYSTKSVILKNDKLQKELSATKQLLETTQVEVTHLNILISSILNSKLWKLTWPLQFLYRIAGKSFWEKNSF